jgi:O-antigen/teichoic acid export membrane protein
MFRNFLKNNIIFAIGSLANSAALFLLIPFLVNSLSTRDYGSWSIIEVTIMILNTILLLGMDLGLMRVYPFLEKSEQGKLVGNIFGMVPLLLFSDVFVFPYTRKYRRLEK